MIIDFNGEEIEFPEGTSDEEIGSALDALVAQTPASQILAGHETEVSAMKDGKVAARQTFNWAESGQADMSPEEETFAQHISTIETGGLKDRYIRTKVKGSASSAYGPYQITRGLLNGYMKKHAELFDANETEAIKELVERQDVALAVGGKDKAKYMPGGSKAHMGALWAKSYGYGDNVEAFLNDFDYGGTLGLAKNPEFQYLYENVARKLLKKHLADAGGNMVKAAAVWHGGRNWKQAPSAGDTLAYMDRMKQLLGEGS